MRAAGAEAQVGKNTANPTEHLQIHENTIHGASPRTKPGMPPADSAATSSKPLHQNLVHAPFFHNHFWYSFSELNLCQEGPNCAAQLKRGCSLFSIR